MGDGQAAVDRFLGHEYDLVLMDVQMPGMDGYTSTRRLRAIERECGLALVPVVALTANSAGDEGVRSAEAGCTAFIAKPFSRSQLDRLVATHAVQPPQFSQRLPPLSEATPLQGNSAGLPRPLPALVTDA
ncbi:MAG: response regulator, partial [Burkholderiaceae bacterium]